MKHRIISLLIALLVVPMSLIARNYDVSITGASPEAALQIINKATGYEFVYNKSILAHAADRKISGDYKNMSLEQILDKVVVAQLGLDFEVVDKTIVLSKQKPGKGVKATVKGVVLDEEGEPLPGATVMVKGTSTGVSTNIDGEFELKIDGKNPVLQVSYVGMHATEYHLTAANTSKPLRITLKANAAMMDEVVVTGYQNIKRENATGAYTVISADDLEKRHTVNLVNNFEGNIPGVLNKQNQYNTEGEDLLSIRGQGTFEARTAPLVVVDGLPIEGGLSTVNPYDVGSITVLKDASAAAIYGARAANGVIVITTKSAKKEKLTIEFNADISITDKLNYDNAGLASAAQLIELERLNWNAMRDDDDQSSFNSLLSDWYRGGYYVQKLSPVKRLFIENYEGIISDAEMNSTLDNWSQNNYRREWQDFIEKNRVNQQYNLTLRSQGRTVTSDFVLNYSHDNMGLKKDHTSTFQFRYRGDIKVAKWFDLDLSVNVLNRRSKENLNDTKFGRVTSYAPYQTIYNPDGTPAPMEAGVLLSNPALSNPAYELKDHSYNVINDFGLSNQKNIYTNIRTYAHANFRLPVEGWTASAQFQYEDIQEKSETLNNKNSYYTRNLYNLYTTVDKKQVWVEDPNWSYADWDGDYTHIYKKPVMQDVTVHHLPDGAIKQLSESSGNYLTFRAQTNYNRTFAEKHDVYAVAGIEYRDVHTIRNYNTRLGYDSQTLTNQVTTADWEFINGYGKASVLGPEYTAYGADGDFKDNDILHRYFSYYFTANYVYDRRYSIFGSYRVDKTDLFGSDPKFRSRPLWSVGLSWNIGNEKFIADLTQIDALKLRASYGITGNIDSNSTSYLTASITTNKYNQMLQGTILSPSDNQLRWEKTSTWNYGVDFGLFGYRLNGSFDIYHKKSSDLRTNVTLDCTTGVPYATQKLNAGCMVNNGFEFQLNGHIITQRQRRDIGVNMSATFSYNKNKVTKVYMDPTSGSQYRYMTLKEGLPLNSMISIDYAGLQQDGKMLYGTWRDHNGEVHNTSTYSPEFTIEDCINSGTTTPIWNGGFSPEVKWNGFSLSGMFAFYGGHVMRVSPVIWSTSYNYDGKCPDSALDYWNGVEGAIPNGYRTKYLINGLEGQYDFRNVEKANYLKFRTLVLSYDFEHKLTKRIGISDLRLRVQMDNIHTWVSNSAGWDPEGPVLDNGRPMKQPHTYTMSLFISL